MEENYQKNLDFQVKQKMLKEPYNRSQAFAIQKGWHPGWSGKNALLESADLQKEVDDLQYSLNANIKEWLREQHNMYVIVKPYAEDGGQSFQYEVLNSSGVFIIEMNGFTTYTEAFTAAIASALNLLPDKMEG